MIEEKSLNKDLILQKNGQDRGLDDGSLSSLSEERELVTASVKERRSSSRDFSAFWRISSAASEYAEISKF